MFGGFIRLILGDHGDQVVVVVVVVVNRTGSWLLRHVLASASARRFNAAN